MEITCPYCGHEQEEPDECYEEDRLYEAQCQECEKYYGIVPYYIKGYTEYKIPCWNGENHDWKPIIGYPEECFEGRERCSCCNEERTNPEYLINQHTNTERTK
jgi:hypothetical protein